MPDCADSNIVNNLTNITYLTSDQHRDVTKARKARYDKDNLAILGFLQERNPFVSDPSLRNIATGVTADVTVNAHKVKEVGNKIIDSMEGINTLEHTFKKKRQVVTMGHKFSASVDGETIQVDPQLLFQRLIMVAGRVTENVEDIFKHELCGYRASLFDSSGLVREANKPLLADAVWTVGRGTEMPASEEDGMCHVLDGCSQKKTECVMFSTVAHRRSRNV